MDYPSFKEKVRTVLPSASESRSVSASREITGAVSRSPKNRSRVPYLVRAHHPDRSISGKDKFCVSHLEGAKVPVAPAIHGENLLLRLTIKSNFRGSEQNLLDALSFKEHPATVEVRVLSLRCAR
jgi:hypothetical protein